MYSVYFSSESGDRASSRRSSCLRSSNRSVRKSFPSQINKSNAKKHGGFPRWNIRFLNCGLPRLSREQISPSMTAFVFGSAAAICFPRSAKQVGVECRFAASWMYSQEEKTLMIEIGFAEMFIFG